jgi:hypothetical protein
MSLLCGPGPGEARWSDNGLEGRRGGKSLGREAAESEDEMGQAMWIDVGIGTGVADMMTESCGGRRILSDRSNVKQIGSGWRSITEDGIGDHRRWD